MQKALLLTDKQAREFYPSATQALKASLETTWGKDFFSQNIMDRVKTVEDACRELGLDYVALEKLCSMLPSDTAAYERSKVVIEALNEGWIADWEDGDQQKWYIWWEMKKSKTYPSGFGFFYSYYVFDLSYVGSRWVFKNSELAKYFATQFADVAKPFFHR